MRDKPSHASHASHAMALMLLMLLMPLMPPSVTGRALPYRSVCASRPTSRLVGAPIQSAPSTSETPTVLVARNTMRPPLALWSSVLVRRPPVVGGCWSTLTLALALALPLALALLPSPSSSLLPFSSVCGPFPRTSPLYTLLSPLSSLHSPLSSLLLLSPLSSLLSPRLLPATLGRLPHDGHVSGYDGHGGCPRTPILLYSHLQLHSIIE